MKEKQQANFLQVNYDLLATTKLSSTQKLFIAYIIGWQMKDKICFETNKNLAKKFGKQYGGIRTVISTLNKFDFFNSNKKDYNEKTQTSGHEITVNTDKLEKFLNADTTTDLNSSTDKPIVSEINLHTNNVIHSEEHQQEVMQHYHMEDIVDVVELLEILKFKKDDINEIIKDFESPQVTFESFVDFFIELAICSKLEKHKGIKISKEQEIQFTAMPVKQPIYP
jgi:hypothetical protein